jgi:polyphenol oxidase
VNLPEPFFLADEQIAIELPGARALYTTRRGGVSSGPYATLNLGTNDVDPETNFAENVRRVENAHGIRLVWGPQVHGTRVAVVAAGETGAQHAEADGRATAAPGVAPMVRTADCMAIAIAGGGAVAMVHAGWRGLAEGVIAEGLRAVRSLAGDAARIEAAIGPAAGVCCYEVGDEVHEVFARTGQDHRDGRNLDLTAIASEQLRAGGASAVHDVGLCTICSDPALFYSHRRDRGITGRQAGIAWLS